MLNIIYGSILEEATDGIWYLNSVVEWGRLFDLKVLQSYIDQWSQTPLFTARGEVFHILTKITNTASNFVIQRLDFQGSDQGAPFWP